MAEPGTFSAEAYFATQPPPPSVDHELASVREFVNRHDGQGRKVVLVTVSKHDHHFHRHLDPKII
jgi:phosphopantothenate---cysteine ligase (ATP)